MIQRALNDQQGNIGKRPVWARLPFKDRSGGMILKNAEKIQGIQTFSTTIAVVIITIWSILEKERFALNRKSQIPIIKKPIERLHVDHSRTLIMKDTSTSSKGVIDQVQRAELQITQGLKRKKKNPGSLKS